MSKGKIKEWTHDDEMDLINLTRDGWTLRQLAGRFGVSRSAIAGKQNRLDVRKNRSPASDGSVNHKDPWCPATGPKIDLTKLLDTS